MKFLNRVFLLLAEFEVLKSNNISEYCFKSQSYDGKSHGTTLTLEKETIDNLNVEGEVENASVL